MIWDFEPGHSAAQFCCRHMMVTWVRGHFKNLKGRLEFDPEAPALASVQVEIAGATIWTGEPERDAHLRSSDFLDVENHPKISFGSGSLDILTPHEFRVNGELTIRGVTKPVALKTQYFGQWETPFWEDGIDKGPMVRAGFCATAVINRHDFGVRWNAALDRGGVVVGDEVHITIDIEAIRKKSR
ncbi:MAG: polyisoprenoid-binding protein [Acidobacteria bacterium]|nr:MAG: polyisoprenoid-binding protein [Acidobacteriota bacterium]